MWIVSAGLDLLDSRSGGSANGALSRWRSFREGAFMDLGEGGNRAIWLVRPLRREDPR